ncbi:MAG: histidinol-phosphate transaminase [Pseudomonadota bacterium]
MEESTLNASAAAATQGLGAEPSASGAALEPRPNPWIDRISPYQGGEGHIDGFDRIVKLSSNENPLGPSPRAIEAFRRSADTLAVYPDGAAEGLRGALAHVNGIDPDRVVCGAGSDEIISLLCYAFCGPGDQVIHSAHGFAMYRISTLAAGAEPVSVPEVDLRADPAAIAKAVNRRTKIIFLANPNNPTGTYLTSEELRTFIETIPPRVLIVLDGAYAEYMRVDDYEDGFALVDAYPNVVTTRTFSKIHGLASLRLGWGYGSSVVVSALNRLRGPFNVSAPALAAGEAAVYDTGYVSACAIQNEVWRDWLTKELRSVGVEVPNSFGNFILPHFPSVGALTAASADTFLRTRGIIARKMGGYGLPDYLRISIGNSNDCVQVAAALKEFAEEAQG